MQKIDGFINLDFDRYNVINIYNGKENKNGCQRIKNIFRGNNDYLK